MDIKQLTAFVTVAELGSVTRAADSLHSTQSSVTRQIQALEQELGVMLFERNRYGMTPTIAGRVMAERSRAALLELGRARAEITPMPTATGTVTVGLLESIAETIGLPLATTVLHEYPGLDLRVVVGDSGHLQRRMDAGELDVCLTAERPGITALSPTPLATEQLWAIAPADALLRADAPVALRDVAEHPMVLPPVGSALRDLLDSMDVRFRVMVTASLRIQKQLVAGGRGWAVLPPIAFAEELVAHSISAAPLHGPQLRRRIVLTIAPTAPCTPAAEDVARLLARLVRSEIRDGRWPSARLIGYRGDDSRLCR
ncbi:LysR family transcriptional regulator [Nocardia vinacea]|uniref:LysR family transcriptional regulator n=1 Tax=Nocardia vinacea TaxID=96468 RepID=A0ABZ1YV98_9NOCA|nr:LysR family transcriptional regulator [Nocardia vinacea]